MWALGGNKIIRFIISIKNIESYKGNDFEKYESMLFIREHKL